jgi:hypothetical protein
MRARHIALVTLLAAVAALAFALLFSRGDGGTRNDALLFLDRYQVLDLDDPIEERRRTVEALATMPFAADEVRAVRDRCVEAHRTLIRAEERGAEARAIFERATDQGRISDDEISTDVRASIESALQESNESLPRARELLRTCMEDTRRLEVRFRPGRRSQR